MAQTARWDIQESGFLFTILRVMAALGVAAAACGVIFARPAFFGLLSGAGLAIALYLATLQAGRVFARTRHYAAVMFCLLGAQLALWGAMAVLIVGVKVDAVGFTFGVSVLPAAIVLTTLYWWLIEHKGVAP